MKKFNLNGIVPILLTPFEDNGSIDKSSLCNEVEFCIDAGVDGIGVALGSEIFKLNETERIEIIDIVIQAVKDRLPVVINTGAASNKLAIQYSKQAEKQGAYAVMVMPPSFMPVGQEEIFEYCSEISNEISISVVLQDIPQASISPQLALRIQNENPNVKYIKVESLPSVPRISSMSSIAGNKLKIFGGAGGNFFLEELQRGACGTMPFASQSKEFVEVLKKHKKSEGKKAKDIFERIIAPVNRLSSTNGDIFFHIHKQILFKKGIIKNANVRTPTIKIDKNTQIEINSLIEDIFSHNYF